MPNWYEEWLGPWGVAKGMRTCPSQWAPNSAEREDNHGGMGRSSVTATGGLGRRTSWSLGLAGYWTRDGFQDWSSSEILSEASAPPWLCCCHQGGGPLLKCVCWDATNGGLIYDQESPAAHAQEIRESKSVHLWATEEVTPKLDPLTLEAGATRELLEIISEWMSNGPSGSSLWSSEKISLRAAYPGVQYNMYILCF